MHRRNWPAGPLVAALAMLGPPVAYGAAQPAAADPTAGWHGRALRDPRPDDTLNVSRVRPPGWSAGAVRLGSGSGRRGGSRRVREVQRRLRGRGYRPGPVDGRFGPRTRAAVMWFQIKHGLQPRGAVDTRTLAALRSRPRGAPARVAVLPPVRVARVPAARHGGDLAALIVVGLLLALAGAIVAAIRSALRASGDEPATAPEAAPFRPAAGFVPTPGPQVRAAAWCAPPAGFVPAPPPGEPQVRLVASPPAAEEESGPERPARVLGYVRLVAGEGGLVAPARAIDAWCEHNGWDLVKVIHDAQPREGPITARPGLDYAMTQIADGEAAGLVLARLGDLACSLPELESLLRWFVDADAFLIALDLEVDASTAAGDRERDRFAMRSHRGLVAVGSKGRRRPGGPRQ